jgi:hypothetical protein
MQMAFVSHTAPASTGSPGNSRRAKESRFSGVPGKDSPPLEDHRRGEEFLGEGMVENLPKATAYVHYRPAELKAFKATSWTSRLQ